jgi:hypothetical protein
MIRRTAHRASALTLVAGGLFSASESRAEDTSTRTESTGPDMREIGGGLVTFGISYGVALGVAATSGHQGDSHLYVPIVGPWLDFGDRGSCPQTGSCDKETTYRVLIVADGIFQALGALSVVSGFLFQTTREVTTTTSAGATAPAIQVTPVQYAHGGLGLAAIGRF